jgi:hypothetical protein
MIGSANFFLYRSLTLSVESESPPFFEVAFLEFQIVVTIQHGKIYAMKKHL